MRAVIGSLEPKLRRFTNRDMTVYFGDVIDHLDKIWDGLDECKEIIEGLNATFDSVSSNRTNEVIRILTILGTILLPLVVITGFYGMNIPLPGQESDNPIIVVVFITVILIGLMLLFFRRIRVI
jgi:magnesium transporter